MTEYAWYEVVRGESLEQGDFLLRCPLPSIGPISFPIVEGDAVRVDVRHADVVVLTQSCDIEHSKVDEILLAELIPVEDLMPDGASARAIASYRKKLCDDIIPNLCLISDRTSAVQVPFGWLAIDFHRLYTLRLDYVRGYLQESGERVRLNPPYKEHMAQSFARYMMRVGLPVDLKHFPDFGS